MRRHLSTEQQEALRSLDSMVFFGRSARLHGMWVEPVKVTDHLTGRVRECYRVHYRGERRGGPFESAREAIEWAFWFAEQRRLSRWQRR